MANTTQRVTTAGSKTNFSYPLRVGTILRGGLRDYKIEAVLGQGGFGITYKVSADILVDMITIRATFAVKEHFIKGICERGTDKKEVTYARPAKDEYDSSLDSFIKEGNRLNQICQINPNIVNVNEVFEANGTAYYVMEYLEGGDLRQMVKRNGGALTEVKALSLIRPIARALASLHKEKLLHLDIKPDNIVMRVGKDGVVDEPVLIDFGIAMHFDTKGNPTTKSKSAGFSDGYSPKEQYTTITSFSPTVDVYALGATLLYLLTGKDPIGAFEIDRRPDYFTNVFPKHISARTRLAIINAMKDRSNERTPTATKFLSSLVGDIALPNKFILKGGQHSYSIIGIEDENDCWYVYKAVRYFGSAVSTSNPTRREVYTIYEFFEKDFRLVRRNADGSLTGLQPYGEHKMQFDNFCHLAQKLTRLQQPGESNVTDGLVNCEFFEANGTFYIVKRDKWTPSRFTAGHKTHTEHRTADSRIATPRSKTIVAWWLAVAVVTILCIALYPQLKAWVKAWQRSKAEPTIVVQDTIPTLPTEVETAAEEVDVSTTVEPEATHNEQQQAVEQKEEKNPKENAVTVLKEPTDDQRYQDAVSNQDVTALVSLANKGYAKAYSKLAAIYFLQRNYTNADSYARKALSAQVGRDEAINVIEGLTQIGYYDNGDHGGKPSY